MPGGASAIYDNAGELTSDALSGTTTNFSYNADGERLAAKQGSATVAAASWNSAGQLTSYSDPAAAITGATYDGNGFRATARTASGTQDFIWGSSTNLLMDNNNAYIYASGTAPAEQVNLSTGAATYLNSDALGSVRGVVSSSGALTATTSYDAWGNPMTPGGLTAETPFGYAGGYTDATGLIYLLNRYYDPSTGAFLSVDPAVGQTGEPYSYADDNPINASDPSGMWMIGIPSSSEGWNLESGFEKWVNDNILHGQTQYRIYTFQDATRTPVLYRAVDIWRGGWMNELKVGPQSPGKNQNTTQVNKDKYLIRGGGKGFYINDDGSYKPVPRIRGGDWWFGYKQGNGCQTINNQRICPNVSMRAWILNHNKGQYRATINIVLVEQWNYNCVDIGGPFTCPNYSYPSPIERAYNKKVANALESNSCPIDTLLNYIPVVKFNGYGCDA